MTEAFGNANPYKGKVVLVTGSTRGIGHAIAEHAASQGAKAVIVNGRTTEGVEKTKTELGVDGYVADVGHYEACKALVQYALKKHQRIDILVNNAVQLHNTSGLLEMDHNDWDAEMKTNMHAPIYMSQIVLQSATTPVQIINIGSGAANIDETSAVPGSYIIAKNALSKMTTMMASEIDGSDNTVSLLQIDGTVDTELTKDMDLAKTKRLTIDVVLKSLDNLLLKPANGAIVSTDSV